MKPSYDSIPVNPFDDNVVKEPRDVSFSVKGLNDAALEMLKRRFERIVPGGVPRRPVSSEKLQLVVSPDKGYGKSHLLGRLFGALGPRATKVYLAPFEDPYKAWHSMLLATVQELQRTHDGAPSGTGLQLRGLAVATLASVCADLIVAHGSPGSEPQAKVVAELRDLALDPSPPAASLRKWIAWLMAQTSDPQRGSRMVSDMKGRGIDLLGRETAWLKVLAAQVLDEPDGPKARAGAKWLRAEPLELSELSLLRLQEADNEGRGDCSPQELNGLSFQRLRGLCLLASYYHPFLFCFDQTEAYEGDRALIRALGNCIHKIYAELPNQMTVITANHGNWKREIAEFIAQPQLDRLSPEILLEGIRKEGARELIRARLEPYGLDEPEVNRFFASGWLESLFDTIPEHGVREVLKTAGVHFETLRGGGPRLRAPLWDLFHREVNSVRSREALMAYNQDVLMWFVKEVGRKLPGVSVDRAVENRYFSFVWSWPDRTVAFAFEGGTQWKRWQAIAREAVCLSPQSPAQAALWYVFRTPDLDEVPRPSWKEAKPVLDDAAAHGFQIRELTRDQVCEIHAARELHFLALQGDIEYSGDVTLEWLQGYFEAFLQELAFRQPPARRGDDRDLPIIAPAGGAPHTGSMLTRELDESSIRIVTDLVRERRLVDLNTVLGELGDEGLRDAVLRSVERHPNLKAHPGPDTIYLQWRITPESRAS